MIALLTLKTSHTPKPSQKQLEAFRSFDNLSALHSKFPQKNYHLQRPLSQMLFNGHNLAPGKGSL